MNCGPPVLLISKAVVGFLHYMQAEGRIATLFEWRDQFF